MIGEGTKKAPADVFSGEEASEILRRAARLGTQRGDPTPTDDPALTLQELERIARESGIDPAHVRLAASETAARRELSTLTPWGAPTHFSIERVVGGELTLAGHDGLAALVRRSGLALGEPSVVGRTLRWSTVKLTGKVDLELLPLQRGTRISMEVKSALAPTVFSSVVGVMVGGVICVWLWGSPLLTPGLGAWLTGGCIAAVGYLGTRLAHRRGLSGLRLRCEALAAGLETELGSSPVAGPD